MAIIRGERPGPIGVHSQPTLSVGLDLEAGVAIPQTGMAIRPPAVRTAVPIPGPPGNPQVGCEWWPRESPTQALAAEFQGPPDHAQSLNTANPAIGQIVATAMARGAPCSSEGADFRRARCGERLFSSPQEIHNLSPSRQDRIALRNTSPDLITQKQEPDTISQFLERFGGCQSRIQGRCCSARRTTHQSGPSATRPPPSSKPHSGTTRVREKSPRGTSAMPHLRDSVRQVDPGELS